MPETLTIAIFVFGAVLLLIGLIGGAFKLFGTEVTGKVDARARIIALILGAGFIGWGLLAEHRSNVDEREPRNRPKTAEVNREPRTPAETAEVSRESRTPAETAEVSRESRTPAETAEVNRVAVEPAPPRQTIPVSAPAEPARALVDLSGTWQDETGSVYHVVHYGNDYEFEASNSKSGLAAVGRGTLQGQSWKSSFETNVPSQGTGNGTLSRDGDRMTGSFRDTYFGIYSRTITRVR